MTHHRTRPGAPADAPPAAQAEESHDPVAPAAPDKEAAPRLPGPSVLTPTAPASTSVRVPQSPTRILTYVIVLAGLVGLSLWYRSTLGGRSSLNATAPSTPSIHQASTGSGRSAPPPIVDSEWAQKACTQELVMPGGDFRLVAAFQSTAGLTAAWEEALAQGSLTSPLREVVPDATVAVCYIDGPWEPPPEVKETFKQLGVVADRGIVLFVQTGGQVFPGPIAPHESLPIERPAASPHP